MCSTELKLRKIQSVNRISKENKRIGSFGYLVQGDVGEQLAVVLDGQVAEVNGSVRVEQGDLSLTHPYLE